MTVVYRLAVFCFCFIVQLMGPQRINVEATATVVYTVVVGYWIAAAVGATTTAVGE